MPDTPERPDTPQHHESHGHSVAAWTAVAIELVAFATMALAVAFPSVFWFVVGCVLVVVGGIAGKVLAMMGYGEGKLDANEASRRTQQSGGVR